MSPKDVGAPKGRPASGRPVMRRTKLDSSGPPLAHVRVLRRKCPLFSMTNDLQRHGFPPLISLLARAYCGEKRIRRSTLFSHCIISVEARSPKPSAMTSLREVMSFGDFQPFG
jgi:hypothetical protein